MASLARAGSPLRGMSPAQKRRKVGESQPGAPQRGSSGRRQPQHEQREQQLTPVRYLRSSEELDEELLGGGRRPPVGATRKSLFDTPDSHDGRRRRRLGALSPLRGRSCSASDDDASTGGLVEPHLSNVNPFCRDADISRASSCWPEHSSDMDSPSLETSRRFSRGSLLRDTPLRDTPPASSTPPLRRVAPPALNVAQTTPERDDSRLSPGGLCQRLRRTCSLVSANEEAMTEEEEEMEAEEDDDDDEEGGLIDEDRPRQSRKSAQQRRRRPAAASGFAAAKTPQPTLVSEHNKENVRRNTVHGERAPKQQPRTLKSRGRSRYATEFEEVGVLGGGTFGTVFRCRNRLDGCMYAVKVTKRRFRGRKNRERVLREVYALSALCNTEDNPHIVRYFSAFVEDGRLFIQTELCDRSLQDMIREKSYPGGLNKVAKDMARQVLEGLARLHRLDLVHLDVKPANIFVKNGTYKVGDLGHACLARMRTSSTMETSPDSAASATPFSSADDAMQASSPGDMCSPVVPSVAPLAGDTDDVPVAPLTVVRRERLPAPPPLSASSQASAFERSLAQLTPVKGNPRSGSPFGNEWNDSLARFETETKPRERRPSFAEDVEEGDSRYMALEVLNEDYSNLTKGDVFSLGASMYEMCLGRELPANGPEWHEIRNGMLDPYALARYDPPLRELVRLLMLGDPVRRPSAESLLTSGGPGGVLRTEWEARLAREKAAADQYRKQLARIQSSLPQAPGVANTRCRAGAADSRASIGGDADFDSSRYRIRRSNTL